MNFELLWCKDFCVLTIDSPLRKSIAGVSGRDNMICRYNILVLRTFGIILIINIPRMSYAMFLVEFHLGMQHFWSSQGQHYGIRDPSRTN